MTASYLLVEFPTKENQALHWWHVEDATVTASGLDASPLDAAGLFDEIGEAPIHIIALVRSADVVVGWHDRDPDLTEKQVLAAAQLTEREKILDPDNAHIVAIAGENSQIATAVLSRDILAAGLVQLQALGIDPAVIAPAGWIVGPGDTGFARANLGFETVIRGERMILPDESAIRDQLVGDARVADLSPEETAAALSRAGALPLLNLRSGIFAKKARAAGMTAAQKRIIGWAAAILIFISIAIPLIQWLKYETAADDADAAALAAATSVLGPVDNLETAERELDERLIAQSRGNSIFSVPASALFSALQKAPTVTLTAISYRGDGTASATLSAVRNEEINPVLLDLQAAGFQVTATPRSDATGVARADISVRAR